VEGLLDEVVAVRLVGYAGLSLEVVHGKKGKAHLVDRAASYNHAARFGAWLVLVDLDDSADCAPSLVESVLPTRHEAMCFRVAVHSIESWLLADRAGMARLMGLTQQQLPAEPDAVPNPKRLIVQLASHSRIRSVREDIIPSEGSGREVGPGYTGRMSEFVMSAWDIPAAVGRSPSLRRGLDCLRGLAGGTPRGGDRDR
jgi:hypothetical protein